MIALFQLTPGLASIVFDLDGDMFISILMKTGELVSWFQPSPTPKIIVGNLLMPKKR